MKEIKQFYRKTKAKIKKKLEGYPGYNRLVRLKNDIAEHIRKGLLAFFSAIGPIWTFLFVKRANPDRTSEAPNTFRLWYKSCKGCLYRGVFFWIGSFLHWIFLPPIGSFCHQNPIWKFIGSFCHPRNMRNFLRYKDFKSKKWSFF